MRGLALLLAALLAFGCATAARDEAPVRDAMQSFIDALNALDLDRMTALFTDDITAFPPTAQADRVEGRAAVTEILRKFVEGARASPSRRNAVPEDMRVEVTRDHAVVTFHVRQGVTRRRTFVFRRVDGEWKISHFHASDV